MKETNVWIKAKEIAIQTSAEIEPGFNIGFDEKIPSETADELRSFVEWVEDHFLLPVTLWVDFEYKHYLVRSDGKRVGYIFYWSDFTTYPVFENKEDIPQIRLPVRTERSTMEEILCSFIEAITDYFAWLCNEITPGFTPNYDDVEDILQEYLAFRKEDTGSPGRPSNTAKQTTELI